jgi:hypothetical protein
MPVSYIIAGIEQEGEKPIRAGVAAPTENILMKLSTKAKDSPVSGCFYPTLVGYVVMLKMYCSSTGTAFLHFGLCPFLVLSISRDRN